MGYGRWIRNQWDRAVAVVAIVAGVVAVIVGWLGTHDALYAVQQIPYVLSGGILGLLLIGLGATAWLSADMRDEWRKLDELCEAVREGRSISLGDDSGAMAVESSDGTDGVTPRLRDTGRRTPVEARG